MPPVDALVVTPPTADADAYEQTHVHSIYETIASHFSATRHKPWPLVTWFLQSRPAGAIGLDIGCGNGKYIGVNPDVVLLGSDRSGNLVSLAAPRTRFAQPVTAPVRKAHQPTDSATPQQKLIPPVTGGDVLVADSLALPFVPGVADFAISIAVVHHFSTRERRCEAVRHILQAIQPPNGVRPAGGISLPDSARLQLPDGAVIGEVAPFTDKPVQAGEALIYVWALEQRSSRRGWDEGAAQDQLVPWVTKGAAQKKQKVVVEEETGDAEEDKTVHRYYHLYRKGELEEDIRAVGGEVVRSGYERDNWWAICRPSADF
ncbi:tRNA (carboxymethyluridine(34)-5-O)-methyltransferase [Ceratocystis lukuohia]|uniref:tRNA (Carboxymethyluridine(34)-5-O)-methyltransferase n=1 Tax=Ceratocystis lukuohia TaxID=2019550 RepID=A0ABR4MSY3_9PEZI